MPAYFAVRSHLNLVRQELVLLCMDNWVCMDWNENLVAFTVDPDAVVEIFKFVARSELDKDVLTDACRNHAFLIILYFEEGS